MGQNLVLNVESRGFAVSVYNRTASVTDEFVARHPAKRLTACATLETFVASLAKPRKVMVMVKKCLKVTKTKTKKPLENNFIPLLVMK
jgi:6-phosphogluconate dehydrogenase